MKILSLKSICAVAALSTACAAYAAPVGSIACTSSKGSATANLSYYSLGYSVPTNIGSGSTGAGAGKATYAPLVVHAALSQFQSFYPAFVSGTVIPTCVLTSNVGGGSFKLELKGVVISAVTATASNSTTASGGTATASAYLEISFNYESLAVDANGPDDGGTSIVTTTTQVTSK